MKDYNIWTTQYGLVLRVEEMTDEHIKNCIIGIKNTAIAQSIGLLGMFTPYFMKNFSAGYMKKFRTELRKRKMKKVIEKYKF